MARQTCTNSFKRAATDVTAQGPGFSISWPGCGVMVFWQLGVLKGLSRHVDASLVPMLGSSSGALVTAMAACGVRPDHAAGEMQRLLGCTSLRQRRLGLVGVLGEITRTWLDNCLPHDAGALLSRRSTVLVTRLPLLTTTHITSFTSKQDVMDVLMASAHLPLVLDGNWYALCRQQPVIDGGFWWWWQRCEKPYRVAGGSAPAHPSRPATTADTTSASSAAVATAAVAPMGAAAAAYAPSFCVAGLMGGASGVGLYRSWAQAGCVSGPGGDGADSGGNSGYGPSCAIKRALAGGGMFGRPGGGMATTMPRPSSAAASPTMTAAATTSAGSAIDFDRSRFRTLALDAAVAAEAGAGMEENSLAPHGCGGSGGGSEHGGGGAGLPVLLVQPGDDDALTAGWRRYRSWRPDDLAAAWEMMRHGEAYGSGPLLRRLDELA